MNNRNARLSAIVGAALPLLIGSCFSATEPVEVLMWDAELIASDGIVDGLSGTLAMVISGDRTQIGVGVRLAPAGSALGWALREGTCTGVGDRVGPVSAFPAIAIDGSGDGAAETILFRRIPTAGPYVGVIYQNDDGTGVVLACGDLTPRE